jgi:hypothetical protein
VYGPPPLGAQDDDTVARVEHDGFDFGEGQWFDAAQLVDDLFDRA